MADASQETGFQIATLVIDLPRMKAALIAGAAVRVLIRATLSQSAQSWIAGRIEISTPITSFKRLKEGSHLLRLGQDPYRGAVFRDSPVLLALYTILDIDRAIAVDALYLAVDLACAWLIAQIALSKRSRQSKASSSPVPWLLALLYLLHPFNILTTTARSTLVFSHLFTLASLYFTLQNHCISSMFSLSLATQLSLYPILLLPPSIMILYQQQRQSTKLNISLQSLASFITHFGFSTFVCNSFLKSQSFLSHYNTILTVSDLTPNVGLCWYFFIEMFDHFRPFFLATFQLHILAYVAPLCIKLKKEPLLAFTLVVGISTTFKSYPSIGDLALFHCLVALFPELFGYMRYPLLSLALLLYSSCLLPAFHHLWLYAGSGNANFYYASTMVYGLGNGVLITDLLWAYLKKDFMDRQGLKLEQDITVVQR